ncbi:MAG: HNH endonuclease signature motif containing protein [Caldilineaceae bacterium]
MSRQYISPALRQRVKERADDHCEYCLVRAEDVLLDDQIDHIIAEQHGGQTIFENLAFSCIHCNRNKDPNIASLDVETGQIVPLFNPRVDHWYEHFSLESAYIRPLTTVGRVTVRLLQLNKPKRVRVRQALIAIQRYP